MANAIFPRLLATGNPTAAGEDFYVTPDQLTRGVIRTIKITNLDPVYDHTLSLWAIPSSGGSASDSNIIYKDLLIPAGTTVTKTVVIVLGVTNQFGKLHTQADADSQLAVSIHGSEVVPLSLTGKSEPIQLAQLGINNSNTQILGASDPNRIVALTILFCNFDASPHDISVHNLFNQFATPGDDNVIVKNQTIAAGETLELTGIFCFADQQYLFAIASASSVITCTVFGDMVNVA